MYEILLARKARKFYEKASDELIDELQQCFDELSQNPYQGANIKKLKGDLSDSWRYRLVNYRVVYKVDDEHKSITVSVIAHRRESYR
jgi:mRNA interferase RelE/StbE